MTVSKSLRKKARKLFVEEGKTIAEIAQLLGVNERTLENWSITENWKASRVIFQQNEEINNKNLNKLYGSLIVKALDTLDMEIIDRVLQLERIIHKAESSD